MAYTDSLFGAILKSLSKNFSKNMKTTNQMPKPPKHAAKPPIRTDKRMSYQDALLIIRNRIELEDFRYHEARQAIADHRAEMDREYEYETDRTWNG